jgi:hypothetical protein
MEWFMDLALARRLERAEGAVSTSFVEVRRQQAADAGAMWHDFDRSGRRARRSSGSLGF